MAHDGTGAGWDVTDPADDEEWGLGALEIRDLRIGVATRLNREHIAMAAASVGGEHKRGSAQIYVAADAAALAALKCPDGVTALGAADTGRLAVQTDTGALYRWTGAAWTQIEVITAGITNLAVTSGKLADDAVITVKILDANVTHGKLADNAVEDNNILDGEVVHSKLAADSVKTVNILDANVTQAKLDATVKAFGARAPKVANTSYEALTDGFASAIVSVFGAGAGGIYAAASALDAVNPAIRTTVAYFSGWDTTILITAQVRQGEFWRAEGSVSSVSWMPLGEAVV